MLKRALMLLIIAGALTPFYWEPAQSMVYDFKIEDRLLRMTQAADADPVDINVQGWKQVNGEMASTSELEEMARQVSTELGISDPDISVQDGDDFRQARVQSVAGNGTVINIAVQSLINYQNRNESGETYITVSIIEEISGDKIETYWTSRLKKALGRFEGESPQVLSNITGIIPKKISVEEKEKIIEDIFQLAGADRIEGIDSEKLVSVTGYTPELEEEMKIGEREVNLNVALRHHSDNGQTYIFIGSPLLIGEY